MIEDMTANDITKDMVDDNVLQLLIQFMLANTSVNFVDYKPFGKHILCCTKMQVMRESYFSVQFANIGQHRQRVL